MAALAVMKTLENLDFYSDPITAAASIDVTVLFRYLDTVRLAVEEFPVTARIAIGANTAAVRTALRNAAVAEGAARGYAVGTNGVLLFDFVRA